MTKHELSGSIQPDENRKNRPISEIIINNALLILEKLGVNSEQAHLFGLKRAANRASKRIARYVLKYGESSDHSVWYRCEITDNAGSTLFLDVADANRLGRDLNKILKRDNQNACLQIRISAPRFREQGMIANCDWSLTKQRLNNFRVYPTLSIYFEGKFEEWYTYSVPIRGELPIEERIKAHRAYVQLLRAVESAISISQSHHQALESTRDASHVIP